MWKVPHKKSWAKKKQLKKAETKLQRVENNNGKYRIECKYTIQHK